MRVYEGSVIIWTKVGGGMIFNNIPSADKYFDECGRENKNPIWQRIEKPKGQYHASIK